MHVSRLCAGNFKNDAKFLKAKMLGCIHHCITLVALINPDVYPNTEGGDIVCVCAGWDSRWWLVVDLRR